MIFIKNLNKKIAKKPQKSAKKSNITATNRAGGFLPKKTQKTSIFLTFTASNYHQKIPFYPCTKI